MSNKLDKLKNNNTISILFKDGKSINNYPFRLIYLIKEEPKNGSFFVSIAKKKFKKAVDRNRIRRQIVEAIKSKGVYSSKTTKEVLFCVSYIGSKKPTFSAIEKGLKETFRIFSEKHLKNE